MSIFRRFAATFSSMEFHPGLFVCVVARLGSYLDVSMITSLIIYPACQKVRYHYLMAAQQHWLITPRDVGSGKVLSGHPPSH